MKFRTTLILLVITVGLGVWIKYFESKKPGTAEAQRQEGNVLNFDRDKLDGIVIENGDNRIELHRQKDKWRLTAPVQDQADSYAVDNLISDLENWRKDSIVPAPNGKEDKASLAEYGVAPAKLRMKLLFPSAPIDIQLGKDAALDGKMYVRLDKSKDVLIAGQTVRVDISKTADEFRDKKLTSLTTAQVTRAVLKTPAGELEVVKKGEHWEITKPLQARGDDAKINDFLAQITNAQIQQFVGNGKSDLHNYGLAEPRGSMTVYGSDDKQGETLQIGSVPEKDKGAVYVHFLPRDGVYELPQKTEDILKTTPNDLRDRHLVRLDLNNLDRVHIQAAGQPEVVLARKGESWTIASQNNRPANDDEVRRLLATLDEEQVAKFVADTASDLPKYGLDQPQLRLTFSSFASQNTAETKAGEHPFLTLAFGKSEGGEVYARVGEEPFIVTVRQQLLPEIWSDPLRWQQLMVWNFKPNDIQHFSRVTDREEIFERAGGGWKNVPANQPVDGTNVQSLLNTLATLHAVRWVGATIPAHGFEKPQLVTTFNAAPNTKTLHKLTIGNQTEDKMWFAKADGRDGTFVISNPDDTALKLPLTKSALPSPTATPPVTSSPVAAPTPVP